MDTQGNITFEDGRQISILWTDLRNVAAQVPPRVAYLALGFLVEILGHIWQRYGYLGDMFMAVDDYTWSLGPRDDDDDHRLVVRPFELPTESTLDLAALLDQFENFYLHLQHLYGFLKGFLMRSHAFGLKVKRKNANTWERQDKL